MDYSIIGVMIMSYAPPEPAEPGIAAKVAEVLGIMAEGLSSSLNMPVYFAYYLFGCVGLTLLWYAMVTVENILRWIRYMVMIVWAIALVGLSVILAAFI